MRYEIYLEKSHTSKQIPFDLAACDVRAVFDGVGLRVTRELCLRKRMTVEIPRPPEDVARLTERLAFTEAVLSLDPCADPGTLPASETSGRWTVGVLRRSEGWVRVDAIFVKRSPCTTFFDVRATASSASPVVRQRARGLSGQNARFLLNVAGVAEGLSLLDPFAGLGSIAAEGVRRNLRVHTTEIEKALAPGLRAIAGNTHCIGDARHLPFPTAVFDAVVTEPPFRTSQRASVIAAYTEIARVTALTGRIVLLIAEDMLAECRAHFDGAGWQVEVAAVVPRTRGLRSPVVVCRRAG